MSHPDSTVFAHVGGYTAESDGSARGLHSYRIDLSSHEVQVEALPPVELISPSHLQLHPTMPILYAVSESVDSSVSTIRLDDGVPTLVDTVPTGGRGACHLTVDPTGRFVVVAHYSNSLLTSHRILHDGRLSEPVGQHVFSGSGSDPIRQTASHLHQVVVGPGHIKAVDTGTDVIHRLRLDVEGGIQLQDEPLRLPAGSGPRHIALNDHVMVIGCELVGDLWLAVRDGAQWHLVHHIKSSVSREEAHPGAVRLVGDTVYVTNRGSESLAMFHIDDDRLEWQSEVATGGEWPRDLALTDDHLWITNQASNSLSVFRRPELTAAASQPWVLDFQLPTPSPACVVVQ